MSNELAKWCQLQGRAARCRLVQAIEWILYSWLVSTQTRVPSLTYLASGSVCGMAVSRAHSCLSESMAIASSVAWGGARGPERASESDAWYF